MANAKLDAMRSLLRCSCGKLRAEVYQHLLLAKFCIDAEVSKLDSPSEANLASLLGKPLAKLWDNCQDIVNVSRDDGRDFMASVRTSTLSEVKPLVQDLLAEAPKQEVHRLTADLAAIEATVAAHSQHLVAVVDAIKVLECSINDLVVREVNLAFAAFLDSAVLDSNIQLAISQLMHGQTSSPTPAAARGRIILLRPSAPPEEDASADGLLADGSDDNLPSDGDSGCARL